MGQQVQAAVLDQVFPGKFHDLPDFPPVPGRVALGFAFFTHGFRVMRTKGKLGDPMLEKFLAVLA
jgi:hypothetical protein